MTGVDVEHTKALEAAATPGEWQPSRDARKGGPFLNVIADPRRDGWRERVATALNPADAEFIAHARTAVPALVAAVERVQALHSPWTNPTGHPYCKECLLAHPCATTRALEMP
ncbi:hypothetical protein [Rhodococcus erythropolis]|uniref:hypothetical protein n=1 Tax=Rhodococcus erythropolis TaxID=1833 RepID=UPI001BEB815C|nr:hypothetical protein [Rhodococcus erythropolis]MBT2265893.1 hypothetical protein [Rhodococcus erythropolis]